MDSFAGSNTTQAVVRRFAQLYPEEVASLLEPLPAEEVVAVFERQPPRAAEVFQCLSPEMAAEVLRKVKGEIAREVLHGMEPARAASLLARLGRESRKRLLALLLPREAQQLQALMEYPAGTAGSLMDPRAPVFRSEVTVDQALQRLRSLETKRVYNLFLVDGEGQLTGSVRLQDAALSAPATPLRDLAKGTPVSVPALASREEVVEMLDRHKLASFPVVDFQGRLIGVIRHDVLLAAAEQEASVDMQTMVGASKEERALSKVSFAVRKRLPWLQINLATAFLAASVVGLFEETIAKFTALAVLLPVVAGQSGNTGAQALVVTMRGIALREINVRHWRRVTLKELSVGILNGLAVSAVTCLGVFFWSGSAGLCFVIGAAMIVSMAIAGAAGGAIPLMLDALGQDPAQSSSIVLTTVTDVMGFFSFLGLATLFSSML